MGSSAGMRPGPYEILAPGGAGRMGGVNEAHDPCPGPQMALKILRSEPARDTRRWASQPELNRQLHHLDSVSAHLAVRGKAELLRPERP